MMIIIIALIVGAFCGYISALVIVRKCKAGVLRIDSSDVYEEPFMFLELSESVKELESCKYVVLQVSTKSYISQK